MKLIRQIVRLIKKLIAFVKDIRKAPRRANKRVRTLGESITLLRRRVRRFGRNPDAERARQYAAKIQWELHRLGMSKSYQVRLRVGKGYKTVNHMVEFVPPLVVTSTGVMLKIRTGHLPHGVKISDIDNEKIISTLAHAVHQDVFINAKDPRAGTMITIAEVTTEDGIPRLVFSDGMELGEIEPEKGRGPLSFVVGMGREGAVVVDLESMPHYLVAGATRQGKSVHMWHIITSLARRNHPDDVRMALLDLKRGAMFYPLRNIPHLMFPVIEDIAGTFPALEALVVEMDERYQTIRSRGQATVRAYNNLPNVEPIPLIVVAIDELAEITRSENQQTRKEGTALLTKLLRQAGGAGMHFLVSTQHPSADVLKGEIRANIPEAIAFRTAKRTQSEIIVGTGGAEDLPKKFKGRALLKYGADLVEVQTPLVKEGNGAHSIYKAASEIATKWADFEAAQLELEDVEDIQARKERELMQEMITWAVQFNKGEFSKRAVYNAFKGRAAKNQVEDFAARLEAEGVLSASAGRAPRRVLRPEIWPEGANQPDVTTTEDYQPEPQDDEPQPATSNEQRATSNEQPVCYFVLVDDPYGEDPWGPYTYDDAVEAADGIGTIVEAKDLAEIQRLGLARADVEPARWPAPWEE